MSRNTIYVEDTELISQHQFINDQFVITLKAPKTSEYAKPGQFVHIQCDSSIPMRRPLSIMDTDPSNGHISIMYRPIGNGLKALSNKTQGETINLLGPIGNGFHIPKDKTILALGGGVGIPPVFFQSKVCSANQQPCILFAGSEMGFPFELTVSSEKIIPSETEQMQTIKCLDNKFIKTRLASLDGQPGIYKGYVTDLARSWINGNTLSNDSLHIIACGPEPMLHAVAELAHEFNIQCDIAVEEFMACAVGGCAGCAVKVYQNSVDWEMKKVCVDGPVFSAASIYPHIYA